MIENERLEDALSLLIDIYPKITRSNMNRKEKLKHFAFAGRRLQNAGLGKYGIVKLKNKAKRAARVAEEFGLPSKGLFLDFGCGAHDPLGLASYFYANGFSKCVANDLLPIRSSEYSALSMYDIVTYMQNFPKEFTALGQEESFFRDRISRFDLKSFLGGDFKGGFSNLEGDVSFLHCDIVESGIRPNSVSYLVSSAVFEHVMEPQKVCDYLFRVTEPGGVHRHFIDLADHRAYRHDGAYNKFSFLTEDEASPNLNRLRASEHVAAFEAAGFEILRVNHKREEIPEETRHNFLPRWQAMEEEDQDTVAMTIILRKPR